MKLKIILSFVLLLSVVTTSYAGFPVTRVAPADVTSVDIVDTIDTEDATITSPAATAAKDKTTALLLWFFLGGFAAHRWYLGSPVGWNILYIITLGGLLVWAIIDLIDIITDKYPGL